MILVFAKNIAKKIQRPAIFTIIQKISLSSDPYFTLTIVILIASDAYFPGKVYVLTLMLTFYYYLTTVTALSLLLTISGTNR